MVGIKNKMYIQQQLEELIPNRTSMDPDLLRNFVTYWWVRKSHPFLSTFELKEIKDTLSNIWLKLIESNHKFRERYGDEKAIEIISLIEKNSPSRIKQI